ncbi:MAG TPA: efflux RND transporter periplasmic adaptor subunit, partial [Sphingomonas sp.]|nr:efflux RND transporter periplasmic adaptor subunit [Sphingomonas sp.]
MQGNDTQYALTDERAQPNRRKWIIAIVVAAVLIALAAAYALRGGGKPADGATAAAPKGGQGVPTVTVVVPGRSAVATTITGNGT